MMNGILMSNAIDAISILAARRQEFNEKMGAVLPEARGD
jgi:hypothetical protein